MASMIFRNSYNALRCCRYSTQASLQALEQSASLAKQDPKVTVLPSGKVVASVENYSPLSKIAVIVKAGSRYETDDNIGISHCLRNCAGLSTKHASIFGITKNIELMGGRLVAYSTREHVVYTLDCLRDNLNNAVGFLTEVVAHPAFKHWEVSDYLPRMKLDIAMLKENPESVLLESLHKAAFRGGLKNSLFCPEYMLGQHSSEMLHEYVKNCFSSDRITVVGIGTEHEDLLSYAENIEVLDATDAAVGSSKYRGGDVRVEMNTPLAYAAVVMEGATSQNIKEVLSAALLQQVLGTSSGIKYSAGCSRLSKIASKFDSHPVISAINLNYTETGLFGVYTAAEPKDINEVIKQAVAQVKEITKSGPSEKELVVAKQQLKAAVHLSQDGGLIEEVGYQASHFKEIISLVEMEKIIDSVTSQDIVSLASKGLKSKPAMAVVGKPHTVLYSDEVI